ncbi:MULTISPECIES: hypothetical protein [unclassified Acinetobacter]|uniref:hypothetical protein n=2 Tax=unclassified Acinetobacter TaxID=196816 RepID=UPI0025B9945C|nr:MULTISPECIES: hypothetical protein [unclassified Acinetobacter]
MKPHPSLNNESTNIARRIINIFNSSKFMMDGVNYLAPLDYKNTRYLNFYRGDHDGITSDDFFKTIIIARVEFTDLNGKKFIREYEIDASEYKDTYKLGKPFEESVPQVLEKMQKDIGDINQNLKKQYSLVERKFNDQKNEWDEFELQRRLHEIKFIKERDQRLGRINRVYKYKKNDKKFSIQQLRKQNK